MTPDQTIKAIELRASGQTYPKISEAVHVPQTTVYDNLTKESTKQIIESIQSQIASRAYQKATDNIIHAIDKYQSKGIKDDPQLREHGFKASKTVLESIGILPSHAPSVFIQQIYNQHNEIHLDQAAEAALSHLGIIDVTPIDE